MSLVEGFIDLAERTYSIDWAATQRAIGARLRPTSSFDHGLYDPARYPAYWCVPTLVGSYVGASEQAVLADTEAFVCGCIVRHHALDPDPPFAAPAGDEDVRAIADAYHGCRLAARAPFDVRFTAKCMPWRVLLAIGTRSIAGEAGDQADFAIALRAIVGVYSCLQVVDDWHDTREDVARSHWNMWVHEPARDTRSVIEPLLRGARDGVEQLRPHLLRRALAAQLRDTADELREIVSGPARARVRSGPHDAGWLDGAIAAGIESLRASLDTAAVGLWQDFALPGVSPGSSECVSAFVATQIGAVPEGRELARIVVGELVARARASGGWGYREDVAEDCDSTAWVLLAAHAAGIELPSALAERSREFIVCHQHPGGGFVTYGPAAKQSLTPADQAGWFAPEVSVTASAVLALSAAGGRDAERIERAREFIRCRHAGGLWESYWWTGFGYATYHALLALSTACDERYEARLATTRHAVLARRSACGGWAREPGAAPDAFSTSFALRVLLLVDEPCGRREVIDEAIAYLGGLLTATGAAPPSAEMLAPGALSGSDPLLPDNGTMTTACVIRALHEARHGGLSR